MELTNKKIIVAFFIFILEIITRIFLFITTYCRKIPTLKKLYLLKKNADNNSPLYC